MTATDDLHAICDRLDKAASTAVQVAEKLAEELAVQRDLAATDRVQIARLIVLVQRLLDSAKLNAEGVERLEQTSAHVAEDLAASIVRADEAPVETPGAGADAALRSPGLTAAEIAGGRHSSPPSAASQPPV